MARKISSPPLPAKIEENLPEYDKYELQGQRDLIAQAKECAVSAKIAKVEIEKLNRQKAGLNKKSQDSTALSEEINKKIEIYNGAAIKKCHLYQPGCVPSTDSKKIISPKAMGEDLNKNYGTKIDFERLSIFEGGEHTVAYIPWWPYLKNDRPKIIFYKNTPSKNIPRLAGNYGGKPENRSGTTIGIGVDLGQASAEEFLKKMKKRNTGAQKISDAELIELHEKIKPYFQKFGGEACQFLREHPLTLNAKESHFLNKVAHDDALQKTISDYKFIADKKGGKKFTDLPVEQQTALFSNGYQQGTASPALINAIIHESRKEIPVKLREHAYLYASMLKKEKK
ncbi:hypothetical protein IV454_06300 [Massilia antarctica]|uniref:Pesticin C-terminal domain-containing protein n=1 Tax=Massilia antarctica TaxID=2765360 RepID=A0AA48WFM1_9BURK|nr:pesticin C-terminus-like muramidase [Massilia antarctica]QPI51141.1 hypothetical protein IV454_06300 [Massilia antarctica]